MLFDENLLIDLFKIPKLLDYNPFIMIVYSKILYCLVKSFNVMKEVSIIMITYIYLYNCLINCLLVF